MKALNIVGQRKIYIFVTNLDDRFNHSFSLYDNKIRGFPTTMRQPLTLGEINILSPISLPYFFNPVASNQTFAINDGR